LGDRYKTLYERFANAWRVSDETSLFDYAPGTSAKTFAIDGWPGQGRKSCRLPPQAKIARAKAPQKKLALGAATRHCNGIVAGDLRSTCVQDVMTAGEPGVAKAYEAAELARRKAFTAAPVVVAPENNKTDVGAPLTFTWNSVSSADGSPVTYMHCLWDVSQLPSFKNCEPVSSGGGGGTVSRTVQRLESGNSYLWKVIAEDGKGASIETPTRRFTVK
jgi:hypothetical protein